MLTKFINSLMICCLLCGSLAAQDIIKVNDALYKTEDIKKELTISPQSKIIIRSASSLSGAINIETHESDIAQLTYIKRAKHNSKSEAIDFIDIISVEFELTHDGLSLD